MLRKFSWTIAAAVLSLAAWAHAEGGNEANTFDMSVSGEGGLTVVCQGESCIGPSVQVLTRANELRGQLGNKAIDVTTSDAEVKGNVGSEPVLLKIKPDLGGLAINGTFAGQIGNLSVNPEKIEGRVGRCSYDLRASAPSRYSGNRSCGGPMRPTNVRVPASITQLPQGQRAAILAMLLSS